MSTQVLIFKLPSGLYIEKMIFDDDTVEYLIVNRSIDRSPSRSVFITEEEYLALLPLGEEVKE